MRKIFANTIWIPEEKILSEEKTWIIEKIEKIGDEKLARLVAIAVEVRKNAYQPYSKYAVGATVLCRSGKIYASCNAEAVNFSQTDHAEQSAITKAISEGELGKSGRKFIKAVVVSHSSKSGPCGACRQRIVEHCDNALIIDVNPEGKIRLITSLKILFPYAFTPSHLEQ